MPGSGLSRAKSSSVLPPFALAKDEPDRSLLQIKGLPEVVVEKALVREMHAVRPIAENDESGRTDRGLSNVIELQRSPTHTGRFMAL